MWVVAGHLTSQLLGKLKSAWHTDHISDLEREKRLAQGSGTHLRSQLSGASSGKRYEHQARLGCTVRLCLKKKKKTVSLNDLIFLGRWQGLCPYSVLYDIASP